MTPIEWVKLAVEVGGPVFGAYAGSLRFALRIGRHLGRQDAQLEWQSRALEGMARTAGTVPPPRGKLVTLDDPWPDIVRDATKR